MKKNLIMWMILALFSLSSWGSTPEELVMSHFKGLREYALQKPYSDSIQAMYLGYDSSGNISAGAAVRSFKSYEKITAVILLKKQGDKFVVSAAEIPDLSAIKEADKLSNVKKALEDFRGKEIQDSQGAPIKIDAVAGATRYFSNIYASLNLMTKKVLEEISAKPDWKKIPLPAEPS